MLVFIFCVLYITLLSIDKEASLTKDMECKVNDNFIKVDNAFTDNFNKVLKRGRL